MLTANFCHECGTRIGKLNLGAINYPVTGNDYQFEKYYKHTTPSKTYNNVTAFDTIDINYKEYITNTLLSGCVEVDIFGRTNVIWVAGKTIGFHSIRGVKSGNLDAIKVVLHTDKDKIHAFPIGSQSLNIDKCLNCGRDIIF